MIRKTFILSFILSMVGAFAEEAQTERSNYETPPIQIYEERPQNSPSPVQQASEQPPIQVLSRPLSPQEKLTRARQNAEKTTEDKIRTQLEVMRLKDEQKRLKQVMAPLEQSPGAVYEKAPSPIETTQQSVQPAPEKSGSFFLHFGVGTLDDFNANPGYLVTYGNIYTGGVGVYEGESLSVEYTYSYSKHRLAYTLLGDFHNNINLHNSIFSLKFYPLKRYKKFKPFVGIAASYSYRYYTTDLEEWYKGLPNYRQYYHHWHGKRSNTIKGGLVAGAEMRISKFLVLGVDAHYFINVHNFQNRWNTAQSFFYTHYQQFPEELNWYKLQAFLRIRF